MAILAILSPLRPAQNMGRLGHRVSDSGPKGDGIAEDAESDKTARIATFAILRKSGPSAGIALSQNTDSGGREATLSRQNCHFYATFVTFAGIPQPGVTSLSPLS